MYYQHTQKLPDKIMATAAVAGLALGLTPPGFLTRLVVVGLLGATAYNFRSLTVEVDDNEIRLQFGDGPIGRVIPLTDISGCKTIRTSPLQGWGIRFTGDGWLYNIYGLDAVELSLNNGKRVLIGTDQPDQLAAAIDGRLIIVH